MYTATDPGRSTLTDYADPLRHELDAATEQARAAGTDHDAALAAADRFAVLIRTLDELREKASEQTKELIAAAIRGGVDPRDFYGRPFSGTVVRAVAKSKAEITFPHRGRRPRTRPDTND
jgi:hypothetical protein